MEQCCGGCPAPGTSAHPVHPSDTQFVARIMHGWHACKSRCVTEMMERAVAGRGSEHLQQELNLRGGNTLLGEALKCPDQAVDAIHGDDGLREHKRIQHELAHAQAGSACEMWHEQLERPHEVQAILNALHDCFFCSLPLRLRC
jgi:hypothetical protein